MIFWYSVLIFYVGVVSVFGGGGVMRQKSRQRLVGDWTTRVLFRVIISVTIHSSGGGGVAQWRRDCRVHWAQGTCHPHFYKWLHWRTQRGLQTPHWIFKKICVACLQNMLSKPCSYVHSIQNFIQENVRNCTLISHFASGSGQLRPPDLQPGLCPWTPLGDFRGT